MACAGRKNLPVTQAIVDTIEHEAGHATIACCLGMRVLGIRIRRRRRKGGRWESGGCLYVPCPKTTLWSWFIAAAAGYAANTPAGTPRCSSKAKHAQLSSAGDIDGLVQDVEEAFKLGFLRRRRSRDQIVRLFFRAARTARLMLSQPLISQMHASVRTELAGRYRRNLPVLRARRLRALLKTLGFKRRCQ
jgi:hypothetical protein